MRIPTKPAERHEFYKDLITRCDATRTNRREFYRQMRSYFLFGCEDRAMMAGPRYNKIFPHCRTVTSFMYSPETTRFTLELGVSVPAEEQSKIPPMTQRLQSEWNDTGIDQQFKQALEWSSPYGKTLLKFRPRISKRIDHQKKVQKTLEIQSFVVEPHNFGVLREDKDSLHRQEAFCETFYVTKDELRNNLRLKKSKEREKILSYVQGGHSDDSMANASPVDRIIVTGQTGDSVTGNANVLATTLSSTLYRPSTKVDLIEGKELYVYDDDVGDYRVVTYVNPSILIWDRAIEDIFLPHRLPYVEVGMNPAYDYFWWHSEVERLVPLQDLRNERMADILHILRKQAHTPVFINGANGGIGDEMALALDTPSGILTQDSPASSVTPVAPTLPPDLWHDIEVIDEMFDEMSGLPAVNQGKGTAGVRSDRHAQLLSNLGATRTRDRSLIVEDQLDACAELIIDIMKRYDPRSMRTDEDHGVTFFANQFPDDFHATVDGHSNSPIFVENNEQKAFALLDKNIIDGEELLDLIEVPMRPALKKKYRDEIKPAQEAAHKEEMDLKRQQIETKRSHGGHGPPVADVAPTGPMPRGTLGNGGVQQ